jgi:hypothetical protein
MIQKIIGFAPAMLDINIDSKLSSKTYIKALNKFGVKPGSWVSISNMQKLNEILVSLTQKNILDVLKNEKKWIQIGSTIAASFAAFNPQFTQIKPRFFAVIGNKNDYFSLFLDKILEIGLIVNPIEGKGNLDICVAAFNKFLPDRTMFLYNGIELEEKINFSLQKNSLIFVSAFEIKRGYYKFKIKELTTNKNKFAIGLGDKKILDKRTTNTILNLLENNLISYMFGDIEEYRKFIESLSYENIKIIEAMQNIFKKDPTIFVITAGSKGIYVVFKGEVFFEPARKILGLVNTNGAGDAAAGGFLSTHLLTDNIPLSIQFALVQAEKILKSNLGILI